MKVLIAEDTAGIARNIRDYLALKWVESTVVGDGKEALYHASIYPYDVLILDIGLPELDWLQVCQQLREKGKDIPIIFLTSRSTRNDIIIGLKKWGDDYMVKPFDFEELLVRLEALTRRNLKNKSTTKIVFGEYEMDVEKEMVLKTGEHVHLSTLEFNLLKYLLQKQGHIVSKEELYEKVWGEYDVFKMWKTVDVYIGYLRKKLWIEVIKTIKGRGYMM